MEVKNKAEALVYETEKALKELDASLSDDEKNQITAAKDELSKALEANNFEQIKDLTGKLEEEFHKLSAKMYEQAQAAAGAAPGAGFEGGNAAGASDPENAPNDGVVDAEFEVVEDDGEEK